MMINNSDVSSSSLYERSIDLLESIEDKLSKEKFFENRIRKEKEEHRIIKQEYAVLQKRFYSEIGTYKDLIRQNENLINNLNRRVAELQEIAIESLENEKIILNELDKCKSNYIEVCAKYKVVTEAHGKTKSQLAQMEKRYKSLSRSLLGRIQLKYWSVKKRKRL